MSVEELINNITDQNFSKASVSFEDLINSKLTDALEAEKVSVANTIFNSADDDEEQLELDLGDEDEDEFTDEEVEDALEDDEDVED